MGVLTIMRIANPVVKQASGMVAVGVRNHGDRAAFFALVAEAAKPAFCETSPDASWATGRAALLAERMEQHDPTQAAASGRRARAMRRIRSMKPVRKVSRVPSIANLSREKLVQYLSAWAVAVMSSDRDRFQSQCESCHQNGDLEDIAGRFGEKFPDVVARVSGGAGEHSDFAMRLFRSMIEAGEYEALWEASQARRTRIAAGGVATAVVAAGGTAATVAAFPAWSGVEAAALVLAVILGVAAAVVLVRWVTASRADLVRSHTEAARTLLLHRVVDHRMVDLVRYAPHFDGLPESVLDEVPKETLRDLAAEFHDDLLPQLIALESPAVTDSAIRLAVELDSFRRGLSFSADAYERAIADLRAGLDLR